MKLVAAPETVIWRIGFRPDPLTFRDSLPDLNRGSRYDSPVVGRYGVLYFASSLDVCFGEVLSPFDVIDQNNLGTFDIQSEPSWIDTRSVVDDLCSRRIAVSIKLKQNLWFVDMSAPETQQEIFKQLTLKIPELEYDRLEEQIIWGKDRKITRLISGWIHDQTNLDGKRLYSGIYYPSSLNTIYDVDWDCWAVFADNKPWQVLDEKSISKTDPSLQKVARLFRLTIH